MDVRRQWQLPGGILVLVALVAASLGWARRAAADDESSPAGTAMMSQVTALSQQLESMRGELAVARLQLDRAEAVMRYSNRYNIRPDLAAAVYDIARAEGIEPDLAFRLVSVESGFDLRARSRAGAIGLTQVVPSTARVLDPGVTAEQLYERDTNLRLGFRYLHDLLYRYDGNLERALLAYNRGPSKVQDLLRAGVSPRNGYAKHVMRGYRRGGSRATQAE